MNSAASAAALRLPGLSAHNRNQIDPTQTTSAAVPIRMPPLNT